MTQTRQRKHKQADTSTQATQAVIYLRVSTDEQSKNGRGLDAQLDLCTNYCIQHDYIIKQVLTDDGLSGKLPLTKRAALQQAIMLGVSGSIQVIVTYAQDRYARNTTVWGNIRDLAIAAHLRLETVKESRDFANKDEQFMGDIYAAVSADEARKIAGRLYGGRRERSKVDGRGSGPVPYGYVKVVKVVGNDVVGHIEIDERARPVIVAILNGRVSGMSYQAIANLLTQEDYERPKGGTVWSFGNVQQIALNEKLYRSGIREWDDVVSDESWPIIMEGISV